MFRGVGQLRLSTMARRIRDLEKRIKELERTVLEDSVRQDASDEAILYILDRIDPPKQGPPSPTKGKGQTSLLDFPRSKDLRGSRIENPRGPVEEPR